MFNFLFSFRDRLVVFEPFTNIQRNLQSNDHESWSQTDDKTYLKKRLCGLLAITCTIFFSNISNLFKNSMKDVFCKYIEKYKKHYDKNCYYLDSEKIRDDDISTQKRCKCWGKPTSKHVCLSTHSKSSFVSIIRFLHSSSKSVWSYLKKGKRQTA